MLKQLEVELDVVTTAHKRSQESAFSSPCPFDLVKGS